MTPRQTHTLLVLLALISLRVFAQQSRPVGPPAKATEKKESPKAPDTWERQKECLAAAKQEMEMWATQLPEGALQDWRAHYSPKYGHCYLRMDTVYSIVSDKKPILTAATTKQIGEKWLQSNDSKILRDVMEHAPIASVSHFGPDSSATGAQIRDRSVTDEEAITFIKDHMEN